MHKAERLTRQITGRVWEIWNMMPPHTAKASPYIAQIVAAQAALWAPRIESVLKSHFENVERAQSELEGS